MKFQALKYIFLTGSETGTFPRHACYGYREFIENMFHRSGLIFPIFLIFMSLAVSHPVTAQESPDDTVRLKEVTITVVPFREQYLEVPGGIVHISAEQGEPGRAISASDLINLAPGVYMASGSYNTGRLVIRGVGSRTPYQSNRIRAYLDDIPLTSGDGFTSLEDMEVMGIGSVEILKGPSSALYG
ncbi:MAG TPA: Plug domain-containing protein, partial [Bacteroides sp.]|nr:Plug domain-containing protein [Bacteroides sp.]